ncbi:MAG TPA: S8 family serine peptidase [Bryobacteraceae bacterium]|jgi:serine protease AprX
MIQAKEKSTISIFVLALSIWVLSGFAQTAPLSDELSNAAAAGSTVDVIVKFKANATGDSGAAVDQRFKSGGAVWRATHQAIRSSSYRVKSSRLAEMANDPDVEYVSLDHPLKAQDSVLASGEGASTVVTASGLTPTLSVDPTASGSSISIDYFRETAHADSAVSEGWDGTGIGIAIIDSGITPNNDFKRNPVYAQSFVPGDSSTLDLYGHGTHVAGIIFGSGKNSSSNSKYQFGGAAPGVNLINLRVLDENGSGTDTAVISAIQQAINLRNRYNIKIINLSLGRPITTGYANDLLCQMVEAATRAGILVVVAAGNEGRNNSAGTHGYGTILAPANDPYVLTVGAMKSMGSSSRTDDLIASYSSKGPSLIDHVVKPDLVAPGNQVISIEVPGSTLAVAYPDNDVPTSLYSNRYSTNSAHSYFVLSGTSMAAPVVSAAAASVLEKFPSLTPDQLKARLMKTASKSFPVSSSVTDPDTGETYVSYYDIFTVGAGYLDTTAALSNYDVANGNAWSPTASFDSRSKTATLDVDASSVIWGTSVTWGTSVIWGTNAFVGSSSVIWGSTISWGATTVSASSVIWGTTAAAASSVIWGSTAEVAQ